MTSDRLATTADGVEPTATAPPATSAGRHRGSVLTAVFLVVAAAPAVFAWHLGAFSVPFLDDWAYLRIARSFALTGHVRFVDWNDVNLLGLLPFVWVVGKTVGTSVADFRIVGAGFYVALVAGVWTYARQFLPRQWVPFAALVSLAFPTAGYLMASLMTDVPAIGCEVWCLVLGLWALREGTRVRRRWSLLVLALAVGMLGATIRQQAVVAPLALLAVLLVLGRRDGQLRRAGTATAAFLLAFVVFTLWRGHFPLGGASAPTWPPRDGTGSLLSLAVLTAGFMLPVLVVVARRARPRLTTRVVLVCAALGALATVAVLVGREFPFGGNGVTRDGALGPNTFLSVGRPPLYPLPVWILVLACMAAGMALAAGLTWQAARPALPGLRAQGMRRVVGGALVSWPAPRLLVTVFATFSVGMVLLTAYTTWFAYDRYAAALVVALVAPLLGWAVERSSRVPWPEAALATGLAVVSLAGTWDAQSFTAARWEAGQQAVARGFPATVVDAGGEWVGYFYRQRVQEKHQPPPRDAFPDYNYRSVYPRFVRQVVVLDEPVAGVTPDFTVGYDEWFGLAHRRLRVYVVRPAR